MSSLVPGYAYDVFISYRQNDNRSGWVTQFVEHLREELAATIKEPVNIYFDENPHDGLLDTHHVDKSLEGKLRCLIFIPILSHTYCDTKSFAWNNEFLPFCKMSGKDTVGLDVRLPNGNVTSRILPIQIHELDVSDQDLYEQQTGAPVRSIDFIFRSPGVNRPLVPTDSRSENLSKALYRDQINKTANAIESIISALTVVAAKQPVQAVSGTTPPLENWNKPWFWKELQRRNVVRAGVAYIIVALLILQVLTIVTPLLHLEERIIVLITRVMAVGFLFALLLAWRYELSPHGVIKTNSEKALNNPFSPSKKKPFTSGPMVFVLIISLSLLALYGKMVLETPIPTDEPISIAVLPFENRSGDPDDKYIAEGITDDIINRLTITNRFLVRTRTSTQQFTGVTVVYDEIVNALKVSYIVKGSIQRSADDILVTAQLMDGKGNYLWGDTYKHTAANIILVQSEIASRIVTKLKIRLDEIELERLNKPATDNATAYDRYLRGRSLYYKYQSNANDSAVVEFKKALDLDSTYARAWAGLGDAFAQMHGRFGREYHWTDSGLLASQRAIDLDSSLEEGYKAKAVSYSYQKKYDQAVPLLLKAVAISPTYVQAVGNLGTNYYSLRDLPNCLKWELTSAGLDPSNWIPYQLIGWAYRLLGDLQEAESWLKRSLEKPNGKRYDTYEHLAYTYVAQGRKRQALKLIDELLKGNEGNTRVLETAGLIAHFAGDTNAAESYFVQSINKNPNYKDDRNTFSPIGLGQIRLLQGNRIEAEVYLSHAMFNLNAEIEQGSQSADLPYYIASIHAIRGNRTQALEWLQKAMDKKWVDHTMIEYGPYFLKYRTDSDFLKIVQFLKFQTEAMRKKVEFETTR